MQKILRRGSGRDKNHLKLIVQFSTVHDGRLSFTNPSATLPNRKVYRTPVLTRYGSLADLTASGHVRGMKDSGFSAPGTG
jgi:hypothetical protein